MNDVEHIEELIKKKAEENGLSLTKNLPNIAKAKYRFFGIENWADCPCVQDGNHSCISKECMKTIEEKGVCHCNLYVRCK